MKKIYILLFTMLMLSGIGLHAQNTCAPVSGLTASLHNPEWNNVL